MRALSTLCVVLTVSVNVLPSDASFSVRSVFGHTPRKSNRYKTTHRKSNYSRPTIILRQFTCEYGIKDGTQSREICIPFDSTGFVKGSDEWLKALVTAQNAVYGRFHDEIKAFASDTLCPSHSNLLEQHLPKYNVCAITRLAGGLKVLVFANKEYCLHSKLGIDVCMATKIVKFLLPNSLDELQSQLYEELTVKSDGPSEGHDDVKSYSLLSLLIEPDDRAMLIPEYLVCYATALQESNKDMEDACANMLVESTRGFFSWEE